VHCPAFPVQMHDTARVASSPFHIALLSSKICSFIAPREP